MFDIRDLLFTPPKSRTGKIIYQLFLTLLLLGGIAWVVWQIALVLQMPV
jgi:hypothetical protein